MYDYRMDSPVAPNQHLPQQPSPLDSYLRQAQSPSAPASNDPGGADTASAQTSAPPAQQAQATPTTQSQQSVQDPATQPVTASQPAAPGLESAVVPGMQKPQPEEILFEWQAPSRPYKARNRQYFTTIGLIAALIGLILIFANQLLPVAVVGAVIFVIYVLNTTPPGMVTLKLTTYGIRVENTLYYWEEMGRFWFTEKHKETILNIEIARFPNRLSILLGTVNKEDMRLVLSEVLLNQEPPPTAYERAAAWLQQKLPIDIES